MKSHKPAALMAAVAASALALAGCSAGQITQTSNQVAAVDGATAFTEDKSLSVQDVTLLLNEDGKAALKFTATNQDTSMRDHVLKSAEVEGQQVTLNGAQPITYNCAMVADSAEGLERIPESDDKCIQYVTTSVPNKNFAYGGNVKVKFNFDSGSIEVPATVAAPILVSGETERDPAK